MIFCNIENDPLNSLMIKIVGPKIQEQLVFIPDPKRLAGILIKLNKTEEAENNVAKANHILRITRGQEIELP